MPRRLEDAILEPPVLVIVGDVVDLHDRIGWFGRVHGGLRAPLKPPGARDAPAQPGRPSTMRFVETL